TCSTSSPAVGSISTSRARRASSSTCSPRTPSTAASASPQSATPTRRPTRSTAAPWPSSTRKPRRPDPPVRPAVAGRRDGARPRPPPGWRRRRSLRPGAGPAARRGRLRGRLGGEGRAGDRIPVVVLADATQAGPRLVVAEGARDARLVEAARLEPERRGQVVLTLEARVEHRRVVGRERADDPAPDEVRQRVELDRRDDPRTDVADEAGVEDDAAVGELAQDALVLDRADPVPEPVGAEVVERAADRLRPDDLARVRDRAQTLREREPERVGVELGGELPLEPPEADGDDAALAEPRRVPDGVLRRLLDAVAVALEDDLVRDAAPELLRRREDALHVHGSLRRGLRGVLDEDAAEIVGRPQGG